MNKKTSKKKKRGAKRLVKTAPIDNSASTKKVVKKLFDELRWNKTERKALKAKRKAVVSHSQLMAASRLVYEHDLAQAHVAKHAGVSLSYLSRLLKDARKAGQFAVKVVPGKTLVKNPRAK